ncbi:MAG: RdgB/HAM1 family non-canonical purine NTP pyrophosphatase [Saprospiraceae bacterium]|nr:RdgB/HAM1 family non-canonical purine NTP pyrophosphatase [Saprospiraceae bacterium]
MKTLIFATSNTHKLSELKNILPNFDIKGLVDIGITEDIPEIGLTLEENAYIKAKYLYDRTGATSFSEDTGLEVNAIDGAPGVHTARYAGDQRNPSDNMAKLLHELYDKEDRSAQFRTVIAMIDGKEVKYFEGVVRGQIALQKSGNEGFGYDPIFIPDGYDATFADLRSDIKNKISHRALAVAELVAFLDDY